jgi:hypothetical protein
VAYNDHTLPCRHDDIRLDHVYVQSFHSVLTNIYPLPSLLLYSSRPRESYLVKVVRYGYVDERDQVVWDESSKWKPRWRGASLDRR